MLQAEQIEPSFFMDFAFGALVFEGFLVFFDKKLRQIS
jgi:hypothetical protein